jgi:transcriptional regulator with XRE-family HTH domain
MSRITPLYGRFGELFRKHREAKPLTQEQVSKMVGLSRTSIANIEAGRQKVLLHQLLDLAAAVEVHPSALLPEDTLSPDSEIERVLANVRPKLKDQREVDWVKKAVSPASKLKG